MGHWIQDWVWLALRNWVETQFCSGIFSALLTGQLRVLHTSTAASTYEQMHPKEQLPHMWLVVMAAGGSVSGPCDTVALLEFGVLL